MPWPETLQRLARWPATVCLPPRLGGIVAAVRTSFRRLRDRCRIPFFDFCRIEAIEFCAAAARLWGLLVRDIRVPVTRERADEARERLCSQVFFFL